MRVLFLSRSTLTAVPAGDTFQVLNTKRALEAIGVEVDLKAVPGELKHSYDLVHLFNTIPIHEIYPVYVWAKGLGLPIVLSPIYWDGAGWVRLAQPDEVKNRRLQWWEETQALRKQVITDSDMVLPNAELEAAKIFADFSLSSLRYRVVPNAADGSFAYGNPRSFHKRFKISGNFVFCAARVDPRKNQLALIDAIEDTDIQLVFAGPGGDASYFRRFIERLGPKMAYLGNLQPRELAHAYAAAKVHALPSWYDTPGLASLEAGLAGCQVVTTDRGTACEYFGSAAYYCNPAEPSSIRAAILTAYCAPQTGALKQLIAQNYTWQRVGQLTKEAYYSVLNR